MPSPVSGSPPLPVATPHAQPAVTVVVASHKYDPSSPSTQPEWMRPDARGPSPLAFFTYQRTNASRPFYSPNYGFEAGVYLQYIVEHYDALPRLTAFVQGTPAEHNRHWRAWLRCLKPSVQYASLSPRFVTNRSMAFWRKRGDDAAVEMCWRNLLDAFDASSLLPPRTEPLLSFHCCSMFVASRELLRRHPRRAYERAYSLLVGSRGRCNGRPAASSAWPLLYASLRCRELTRANRERGGAGLCAADACREFASSAAAQPHATGRGGKACPPDCRRQIRACAQRQRLDPPQMSSKIGAGALEHLQTALIGNLPLQATPQRACDSFVPDSQCPGSPCKATEKS